VESTTRARSFIIPASLAAALLSSSNRFGRSEARIRLRIQQRRIEGS
jgi:hypothetical protein